MAPQPAMLAGRVTGRKLTPSGSWDVRCGRYERPRAHVLGLVLDPAQLARVGYVASSAASSCAGSGYSCSTGRMAVWSSGACPARPVAPR